MSQPRCGYGQHIFDVLEGMAKRGSVCLCGSVRIDYQHSEIPTRWFSVPFMDGGHSSQFSWIGERTP